MNVATKNSIKIAVNSQINTQLDGSNVPMANNTIENFQHDFIVIYDCVWVRDLPKVLGKTSVLWSCEFHTIWKFYTTHKYTKRIWYQPMIMVIYFTTTTKISESISNIGCTAHRLNLSIEFCYNDASSLRVLHIKGPLSSCLACSLTDNSKSMGEKLVIEQCV